MPIDPPDSVERERVHTTICGKQGGIPMAGDSLFLYPFSMQKRCANDANLVDLWIVGGDHLLMDVKCGILHCQIEVLGGWDEMMGMGGLGDTMMSLALVTVSCQVLSLGNDNIILGKL